MGRFYYYLLLSFEFKKPVIVIYVEIWVLYHQCTNPQLSQKDNYLPTLFCNFFKGEELCNVISVKEIANRSYITTCFIFEAD